MSTADAAAVHAALAAGTGSEFSIEWGTATLRRHDEASSSIELRRAGWRSPDLVPATLPGTVFAVESVALGRGFQCRRTDESMLDCGKGGSHEFKISAQRAVPHGLRRLFISVDTGRDDTAMTTALAEVGAVLDAVGGPRAAAAKSWFNQHRATAGASAYVGGLHASLTVTDTRRRHAVQLEL